MQFAQLIQLREIGVPIPDEQLIEACTLQNKKDLIESLQQTREQQTQMQQNQAQMQLAEMQARINNLNAQARANEGLGNERDSRVPENHALAQERRAKAINDEEHALLEKVRILKELDGIDIDHLNRLLTMANVLKEDTLPIRNGSEVGNLEAL
jgi:type I site-specific restriction endonuclease